MLQLVESYKLGTIKKENKLQAWELFKITGTEKVKLFQMVLNFTISTFLLCGPKSMSRFVAAVVMNRSSQFDD